MNNSLNVQPQSLESEQAVLGSMLISKEAVDVAISILSPEHFYKDSHSKIFSAMTTLSNANENVDTITVVDSLKMNKELEGIGGAYYITGLVETVPTTANIKSYSEIVLGKAKLRQLILLSHELASMAYDDREAVDKIINYAEEQIFQIAQSKNVFSTIRDFSDILHDSIEKLELIHKDRKQAMGVPSGIIDLDKLTLGFHPGELNYIAGRPSMGKTALALTIARHAAKEGYNPLMFTLEMSDQSLVDRVLFTESRVDSHKARSGFLSKAEQEHVYDIAAKISELPITVVDCIDVYAQMLRSQARMLVRKKSIDIIIIDYLQLMFFDGKTDNRQQEITRISGMLKSMAKELKVPVVALSQLSRNLEYRPKNARRPVLSDLRESGAIEQDADNVYGLYRDWVYNPVEPADDFDNGNKNDAEIIILKQRNGPTGKAEIHWIPEYTRFENRTKREEE